MIKAKAWDRHASCRQIAQRFNRTYLDGGYSISKSFVADQLKRHFAAIAALRARWKENPPSEGERNKTWAMDLSFATDHTIKQRILLGILDHGTRACLVFDELANKRSHTILHALIATFRDFGIPKHIRVDNERCFHGIVLRFALSLLGVKVQTTAPHSPWQNGRIERFFGTFKRDFARVVEGNLETLIAQWRFYYNFARPHQHLNFKTPAESWSGKAIATGEAQLIELWDGELRCAYFASD